MKSKKIFSLIIAAGAAAAIILLSIAAASAWYSHAPQASHEFEVRADGVLYIYVPAKLEESGQRIRPAVAMPHAVAGGKNMDVLSDYESSGGTSWVQRPADIMNYTAEFTFYNEYMVKAIQRDEHGEPVYERDEFGNLILDEFGDPVPVYLTELVPATDTNGNIIYQRDENGDYILDELGNRIPVMTEENVYEPCPARISYEITYKKAPSEESGFFDSEEFTLSELFFSYSSDRGDESARVGFLSVSGDNTVGTIRVSGTKKIYIHMSVYLTEVEELVDPAILGSDVYISLTVSVQLEGNVAGR